MTAHVARDAAQAVGDLVTRSPGVRILICGSLYLAGRILRDNG